MVKEIVWGVVGVVVGVTIVSIVYAVSKFLKQQNEIGINPERAFSDEVSISEVKKWFFEKINNEDEIGVLLYPNKKNLSKWNLEIKPCDNIIIQMVYNQNTNEVINYREIAFSDMGTKLRELLDNNGGMIVIEK